MQLSNILPFLAVLSTASAAAIPEEANALEARANFPGLNALQSYNARGIVAKIKAEKLGSASKQACLASITTAITEACLVHSGIRVLANKAVPASLKYHRDGFGSDHDSVGVYQQRAMYYPDIACDMNVQCSTGQFLKGVRAVRGWQTMDVATLCQTVQRSGPNAYHNHVPEARKVCAAAGWK